MSDSVPKSEAIRILLIRSTTDSLLFTPLSHIQEMGLENLYPNQPNFQKEDEQTIVEFFKTQWDDIEFLGWAKHGYEGIEQAKALKPDVVLVDITIEDMHTAEVVRLIRATLPNTKIITMSDANDPAWIMGTIEAGADHYVSQPLIVDDVYNRIRKLHDGTGSSLREQWEKRKGLSQDSNE